MSKIQWTNETWNPITGCSKVSAGCKNCYAEQQWPRFANKLYGGRAFTDVQFHPERLDKPLRWRKPRMVFVNSMSDLFHDDVPDCFITEVFGAMAQCPRHTFQILTKRPLRAAANIRKALPNVWLGVSAESQETFDERVPLLLRTPAAVRWVSLEPLLGPVDLHLRGKACTCTIETGCRGTKGLGEGWACDRVQERLSWVVVGGESGPKARPCNIEWVRDVVEQCKAAGVPVFVKQLGAAPAVPGDTPITHPDFRLLEFGLKDRKGGNPDEWPEDLRVREWPNV